MLVIKERKSVYPYDEMLSEQKFNGNVEEAIKFVDENINKRSNTLIVDCYNNDIQMVRACKFRTKWERY